MKIPPLELAEQVLVEAAGMNPGRGCSIPETWLGQQIDRRTAPPPDPEAATSWDCFTTSGDGKADRTYAT